MVAQLDAEIYVVASALTGVVIHAEDIVLECVRPVVQEPQPYSDVKYDYD